jgi:DNA-binding MarR family transcriptional regulator
MPRRSVTQSERDFERPDASLNAAQTPSAANGSADTPIRYGPLGEWIGFHLRMAQIASFQAFARQSESVGMRPGRFAVLVLINENPGISQTELSRANGRDKSTLTPVLNDLVRRGLVARTRTPHDRRTYRLTLTPAGEAMLRDLTACARRHEKELDRVIGMRDRAKFLRILRKLMTELN